MADKIKPPTNRKGLRFQIAPRTLRYRAKDQEGEALISDISAGGCFAVEATAILSPNDLVLVFLDFIDPENILEIEALVLRAEEREFALKFLNVSDELHIKIVKFFAADIRKNRLQAE